MLNIRNEVGYSIADEVKRDEDGKFAGSTGGVSSGDAAEALKTAREAAVKRHKGGSMADVANDPEYKKAQENYESAIRGSEYKRQQATNPSQSRSEEYQKESSRGRIGS